MALELGPLGIRVNAVVPGMIRTPMTAVMFEDPENAKRIRAAHPIGREGRPQEVAAAIAFLLSDDASFITGVALPVDGGSPLGAPRTATTRWSFCVESGGVRSIIFPSKSHALSGIWQPGLRRHYRAGISHYVYPGI